MRRGAGAVVSVAALLAVTGCTGTSDGSAGDAVGRAPSGHASSIVTATPPPSDPAGAATSAASSPVTGPSERNAVSESPDPAEQARLDNALVEAAWADDVPRARRLVEAGADVNHKDGTDQSAFLIAASEGYLRLLELTLRHGADVGSLDSFDGTALIRAAERGHADVVGRLLQTDIAVDHVNNLGWTALHEAVILGDGSRRYVDTVRLLVAAGADVHLAPVRDGIPPVEHARAKGYDDIARLLAEAGDPGRPTRTPDLRLLDAAAAGRADAVALALRDGADLEARDERRRTPLLLAVTHDRVAVARLLVALGADPDAVDDQHDTPWLVTGVTGSVEMLEILLPARPDLTARNRFGGVSVIPASERGHVAYVRRVVQTGIDVNHVNDLGWTALLEAVILGDGTRRHQEIVRILLDAGADPAIADRDGMTALEHAERSGQTGVARILRQASG